MEGKRNEKKKKNEKETQGYVSLSDLNKMTWRRDTGSAVTLTQFTIQFAHLIVL